MSYQLYGVLAVGLTLAFIICCIVSAMLQIIAWSRHTPPGTRVRLRAIWNPLAGPFDDIGIRQMVLARSLLLVGIVAYLGFGALIVVSRMTGFA